MLSWTCRNVSAPLWLRLRGSIVLEYMRVRRTPPLSTPTFLSPPLHAGKGVMTQSPDELLSRSIPHIEPAEQEDITPQRELFSALNQ